MNTAAGKPVRAQSGAPGTPRQVRPQSWTWPALHPFFQVSLPEGFLLDVLREQLGPHLGAHALDLLSVTGHNTIGRIQVSAGESVTGAVSPGIAHH